jgi:molybdate transport system substrate-binding protein
LLSLQPPVDKLIMQGRLIGGTRTAVAVSAAGVAVRKDAAKPYISTVESFKRTLLNARSITFGEQGGTGAYLMALFGRLGIADAQQIARDPVPAAKAGASA